MSNGHVRALGLHLTGALLVAVGLSCNQPLIGPRVAVAFRYDDYSSKSDTQLELRIFQLFQQHGIPCTVAVIPEVCQGAFEDPAAQQLLPLSEEKAAILRERVAAGMLEVAQHGLSHQVQTTDGTKLSEFRDLPYDEQLERMAAGKAILEQATGMPVRIFVPPWDTYDANTVAAAEDLGYSCLSADTRGVQPEDATIVFVPKTSQLDTVEEDIDRKRIVSDGEPIVVLFHASDFREVNPAGLMDLAQLEQVLAWISQQSIVRTGTIGQIASGGGARQ